MSEQTSPEFDDGHERLTLADVGHAFTASVAATLAALVLTIVLGAVFIGNVHAVLIWVGR